MHKLLPFSCFFTQHVLPPNVLKIHLEFERITVCCCGFPSLHVKVTSFILYHVEIPINFSQTQTYVEEQTNNWENNVVCIMLMFIFKNKSNIRNNPVHDLVMISHAKLSLCNFPLIHFYFIWSEIYDFFGANLNTHQDPTPKCHNLLQVYHLSGKVIYKIFITLLSYYPFLIVFPYNLLL